MIGREGAKLIEREGDLSMSAPADFTNKAVVAHCLFEPDPLVLELCAGTWPHAWVDPMLEELTALLF